MSRHRTEPAFRPLIPSPRRVYGEFDNKRAFPTPPAIALKAARETLAVMVDFQDWLLAIGATFHAAHFWTNLKSVTRPPANAVDPFLLGPTALFIRRL